MSQKYATKCDTEFTNENKELLNILANSLQNSNNESLQIENSFQELILEIRRVTFNRLVFIQFH